MFKDLEYYENKYKCSLSTIASVVGIAGGVTSIGKSLFGGGSGGGAGGDGGLGTPANYNPGNNTIATQNAPDIGESTPAQSSYNPQQEAQKWIGIFQDSMNPKSPDNAS